MQGIYNWVDMECESLQIREVHLTSSPISYGRCICYQYKTGNTLVDSTRSVHVYQYKTSNTLVDGTHSGQVCQNNGNTLVDGTRSVQVCQHNMMTLWLTAPIQ